jgi:cold shock CspA family protein
MEQQLVENLKNKWEPVLNCEGMEPIKDNYRRNITSILLENQEKALREEANISPVGGRGANGFADTNGAFNQIAAFDPVLISLVRRSMPNLIAYDICGVQPMSGPTGLIFAMKAKFNAPDGNDSLPEPFFDEAPTQFSGFSAGGTGGFGFTGPGGNGDIFASGSGITQGGLDLLDDGTTLGNGGGAGTRDMEVFGGNDTASFETSTFDEMSFVIDRTSVVARTRALKAEYTSELAQDLKATHGLDAEVELANILSTEILAEINREIVRLIYNNAKLGAQQKDLFYTSTTSAGVGRDGTLGGSASSGGIYDLDQDSDGRWSAEKFRGLMFQIEREANVIAKETRRGKGNFIICTSDVASALAMSGFLNLTPTPDINLTVDDTGNTFAGTLNGRMKVYIDPYSTSGRDYCVVGYRGSSPYDAGMFYCPYVPLQMVRAVDEDNFQPKIGFKTRYGIVNNPFVSGNDVDRSDPSSTNAARNNQYYRAFRVAGLHGAVTNSDTFRA